MRAPRFLQSLALAALTLGANVALAAPGQPIERFVLDLNGREFNSAQGETTVALKQLIQQRYGNQDLEREDLVHVAVMAKSQMGRAQMSLLVGRDLGRPVQVAGNPFQYARPGGFTNYVLQHPGREASGVWQLKLNGNVKIDRIVVVVRDQALRFALDLRGQEFNSAQREDTIALKQLILQRYGNVDLRGRDVTRVSVQAKSRAGQAQMGLLIGNRGTVPQRIAGNPRDYMMPGRFGHYVFQSPGRDSAGVWQLKINGNVKVGQIIVELR